MKSFILLLSLIFSQSVFSSQNVKLEFDLKIKNQFASDARFIFVVDNSGSMQRNQMNFANALTPAIEKLRLSGVNFDAHLLTTESYVTEYLKSFTSLDTDVSSKIENEIRNLGVNGNASEKQFASLLKVLANISDSSSYLNIILVSDEDEQSNQTAQEFYDALSTSKKGLQNQMNLYAITFDDSDANCSNANGGSGNDNSKMFDAISLFGNKSKVVSICDEAKMADAMGLMMDDTIANLSTGNQAPVYLPVKSIQLGLTPEFSSLQISYGDQVIRKGLLPAGYVYHSVSNKVFFGDKVELSVQPQGTKLVIEYLSNDDITSGADTINAILELH